MNPTKKTTGLATQPQAQLVLCQTYPAAEWLSEEVGKKLEEYNELVEKAREESLPAGEPYVEGWVENLSAAELRQFEQERKDAASDCYSWQLKACTLFGEIAQAVVDQLHGEAAELRKAYREARCEAINALRELGFGGMAADHLVEQYRTVLKPTAPAWTAWTKNGERVARWNVEAERMKRIHRDLSAARNKLRTGGA